MQGVAKAVLISILVLACILLFINMIFFFPWYMAIVVESFNLSQAAANYNYIKQLFKPYRQRGSPVSIKVEAVVEIANVMSEKIVLGTTLLNAYRATKDRSLKYETGAIGMLYLM
jgi:hypothetical protein